MYGVGLTNVFDTYLSPQEYTGIDFRVSRESMRMTGWIDSGSPCQSFFQADLGYTRNKADNNNTFSALANWNYGLHYNFPITDNFKLLAGGLADLNGGFVLQPAQYQQSGIGTRLYQSGRIGHGHLELTHKELSADTALPGQSAVNGRYVLTALRAILLRNLLVGQQQRSGEIHLIAQPAVTAANAYGRLSGGTCQNAFRLYMGRAAVTRERYKDTHLLARIHGGIREGTVFIEKQEKEIKKRSDK